MRTCVTIFALALAVAEPSAARGAAPNWAEVADEQEIVALIPQEDGTTREVTIWLAVVDGQGYIRTRNTSWRSDLERDPNLALRIAGADYPVRVVPVKDPALHDRVNAAFTEKYGVTPHIFLGIMRPFLGPWNAYRVEAR